MKSEEELKPCPFCGKKPNIFPTNPEIEGNSWCEIQCSNKKCGEVIIHGNANLENFKKVKKSAIDKWNKRINIQ